ncbi:MAG: ChaN family lipoprotein, partial [Nitrospiraceae bacterium]
ILYRGRFRHVPSRSQGGIDIIRDIIDEQGVSLTGTWYPEIKSLFYYSLNVTLPKGYTAVSEAEEVKEVTENDRTVFSFNFPHPLDSISLVASDRYEVVKDNYRDIEIYAYFLDEDINLAKTYIDFTKKYLSLYEDLIGRYPYRRFSIVENFLPTGYSMPTFTLLGRSVVRLPFIVETSLGHEILHQWFGNHVFVDTVSGNWAEGLTTYLADHLYEEEKGKGWEYRKQMLINYQSYVTSEKEFPLKDFIGGGTRASRAIGYGKVAMIFHMLKTTVGEDKFFSSLRDFISENRYRLASWHDLQLSFGKHIERNLDWFFSQWINERGIPAIGLSDVSVQYLEGNYALSFSVSQGEKVFTLDVPVTVYAQGKSIKQFFRIDSEENKIKIFLTEKPVKIVLDEDYDMVRGLDESEFPPVLARLFGEEQIVLSLPVDNKKTYRSIVDEYRQKGAVVKKAKDIQDADILSASLVILGADNPLLKRLYGRIFVENAGFSVVMKKNPWSANKVVAVFHGESKKEVDAAFRKISRYGKYGYLLFENGRNIEKGTEKTPRGIVMKLAEETPAVDISSLKTLPEVIEGVSGKKVIYVGEMHDVFAHHAVQLDIITGIYQRNRNIAIGMEMFQRPFQNTLDDFVRGDIDEKEFLKKSEYFKRWGFDYNLYKPILDFARARRIPVVALNLDRETVREVSEDGLDSLGRKERKKVPPDMDFSDRDYRRRIEKTFRLHKGSEDKKVDFFYQAQVLWDETMARSIDEFLGSNPEYQLVVLAGQGHLAFGSGIPKRTYRRNGIGYATIMIDAKVEKGIADFVLFPKPVEGISSPKLMVFLERENQRFKITGFPEESVSEKAGLKTGDILLVIDNILIEKLDDIKIQLLYKKQGETVRVKVLRKEEQREKTMEFEVEL